MSPPYYFRSSDGELHVADTRTLEVTAANGKYIDNRTAARLRAQLKAKKEPTHISHAVKKVMDNYPRKK